MKALKAIINFIFAVSVEQRIQNEWNRQKETGMINVRKLRGMK